MRWIRSSLGASGLAGTAGLLLWLGGATSSAPGPPQADPPGDPSQVGELGPLIPFHKDAVHATLLWNGDRAPRLYLWMRPSQFKGTDLVDPAIGELGELRPSFAKLVYGGFPFSSTLDGSVRSRIKADIPQENFLGVDLENPDVFANNGKFRIEDLNEQDFALNAAAFSDSGSSKGLNYDVFCQGNAALADGRLLIAGGHDKTGNAGLRKINIFDPETESWLPRAVPPVKTDFLADPTGTLFPHANALDESNTDPPDPSDMRYQRWYPTVVPLPDGRVLILSGTDEDTSVGPGKAAGTKVRQAVPEVYDPGTDTTVALENARKLFMMFPRAYVVQSGPGKDDWKVAVTGEVQPPLPSGDALSAFDPFKYNGNTYFLDVLGALADPDIDVPAENHWELVATAQLAHNDGAGAALWILDENGEAASQRIVAFGGNGGAGSQAAATVEMIDFADANPSWVQQDNLLQPVTQNNAVVLPDGNVVIIGGASGRPTVNSFRYQMFNPDTGQIASLVQTNVPRYDHSTALLLPDATVVALGGNRTELVPGNENAGVPVAQIYKPPYLFRGPRPVIERAPDGINYATRFSIKVSGNVESVVMIRTGPVTHNWDWGNRYVKLAYRTGRRGRLVVTAPAVPGLAVPGYYMLFVLSDEGVPSVAKLIHLDIPE